MVTKKEELIVSTNHDCWKKIQDNILATSKSLGQQEKDCKNKIDVLKRNNCYKVEAIKNNCVQKIADQKLACTETIESTKIECEQLTTLFKNALENERKKTEFKDN